MRYVPALDGLRGLAVLGVLLFHAGLPMFSGGFLGVSTFFTLSGFLITAVLLRDHDELGRVDLRRFWMRRARRLMPAAFLAMVGTAVYASVALPGDQLDAFRGDLLAALFYVANWHFLASGQTYSGLNAGSSLLQHFWSLSIEEQFYLLFPLVAALALCVGGRRLFARVVLGLAVASVASAVLLTPSGRLSAGGPGAGYYATNSRAVELLVGAMLAIALSRSDVGSTTRSGWLARWQDRRQPAPAAVWSVLGGLALVAGIACWALVDLDDAWLTRGGLALHAVGVAVVLLAVVRESDAPGVLSRVLAFEPLRWVGQVSYGVYLYHWPLFRILDESRTGQHGWALLPLRLGATLALAGLSYALVEQPVRRALPRLRRPAFLALPAGAIAMVGAVVVVSVPAVPIAYGDTRLATFHPTVQSIQPQAPAGVVPVPPTAAGAVPLKGSGPPVRAARSVLVLGDSALYGVGPALSAVAPHAGITTLVDASYPGVGLTDGFNWRYYWRQLIDQYDPDVVVIMVGRWDGDFLRRQGDAAYTPLVEEAARLLTRSGAHVLWLDPMLGPPVGGDNGEVSFHQVPALLPGRVVGGDINPDLRAPDGSWLTSLPGAGGAALPVRQPDLYHLCPAGAERVTDAILAQLVSLGWTKPATPGWRSGSWRQSPRYVRCPAEPSGS